ncbi:MAG TPA: hypothetical protein DHV62_04915, partial [Elusimicrobia bacterium]|nr:hypothetical protein [Elusimicrobiota bacterium]
VIYMSHAIYTHWGPAFRVAMQRKIPVVKMGGGYLPGFTYFRKIIDGSNVHQGLLSDSGWNKRKAQVLTNDENELLDQYIKHRYAQNGCSDLSALEKPKEDENTILKQLGINRSKPIWCIFTNVGWDASIDVSPIAFQSPTEWLVETIKTIINIQDIQWLIKIHPGEITSGTVNGAEDIIKEYFSELPPHVKIISSTAAINTYDVYRIITGGVTCMGNTSGLELTMLGKPMIVAGESIYAKKGFTYDGLSVDKYLDYLKMAPKIQPLSKEQQENARKLAYSHFLQQQIPLRMFKTINGRFSSFDWRKVESLIPSKDQVMDIICERFFKGGDFILNDEIINANFNTWEDKQTKISNIGKNVRRWIK